MRVTLWNKHKIEGKRKGKKRKKERKERKEKKSKKRTSDLLN